MKNPISSICPVDDYHEIAEHIPDFISALSPGTALNPGWRQLQLSAMEQQQQLPTMADDGIPDADLGSGGLQRTLKDLFAGAAGGVAQVLLGKYGIL